MSRRSNYPRGTDVGAYDFAHIGAYQVSSTQLNKAAMGANVGLVTVADPGTGANILTLSDGPVGGGSSRPLGAYKISAGLTLWLYVDCPQGLYYTYSGGSVAGSIVVTFLDHQS